MEQYEKGPLYTPLVEVSPGVRGTWIYPGFGGGANWNGAAVDPTTNIMYVPIRHRPNAVGPGQGRSHSDQHGLSCRRAITRCIGPRGLPILKPPYSELVAVDMNRGEHLWRIPLGGAPQAVRNNPALKGTATSTSIAWAISTCARVRC